MAEQSSDSVERLAEGARVELEDRKRLLRGGVICEEFVAFYYEYKSRRSLGTFVIQQFVTAVVKTSIRSFSADK